MSDGWAVSKRSRCLSSRLEDPRDPDTKVKVLHSKLATPDTHQRSRNHQPHRHSFLEVPRPGYLEALYYSASFLESYWYKVIPTKDLLWSLWVECILGGLWVVISRVISRVTILITHIRGLRTPVITTHEPASRAKDVGPWRGLCTTAASPRELPEIPQTAVIISQN